MKKQALMLSIASVAMLSSNAFAVKLSDYSPYEYDIRFTNPECKVYKYSSPIKTNGGGTVAAKPKNAYCTQSDSKVSGDRPESPLYKFVEWINAPDTKEVFFTYLSISNSKIIRELCKAIEERNVKVRWFIDASQDTTKSEELKACKPKNVKKGETANFPEYEMKGRTSGDDGIGYSHNKLFVINPYDENTVKFAFSSGNLSSGVVLHHENWHFVTTSPKSYFYQSHLCLIGGMERAKTQTQYANFVDSCQAKIQAPKEEDITAYFIPGDGKQAVAAMKKEIQNSDSIDLAAHRLKLTGELIFPLTSVSKSGVKVRAILDDDIYVVGVHGTKVGDNDADEYKNAESLRKAGAEVRWMETNHSAHLLHHNKYLIFDDAVLAGAANFTSTGYGISTSFPNNYENIYMIRLPEVVKKFKAQYNKIFATVATEYKNLPKTDEIPLE
jgi:hypothetical protein